MALAPQIGLAGSEQAQQAGLMAALAALESGTNLGREDLRQGIAGAQGTLQPFAQPGAQAIDIQAALAGAQGPEAQRAAFGNFISSPGQEFLRDRGEQALLRNASAIGGLGGGNVRSALQQQGIGFAAQDFSNAFNRLGGLANTGLNAAGQQAGIRAALSGQAGNLAAGAGQAAGNFAFGTGQSLAGGRTRAGEQIAGQISGTTSALADLVAQQGAGISDITGSTAGNIANLLSGQGLASEGAQQQLAAILANLATKQGSTIAGLPGVPGVQQTTGALESIGKAAAGIGTAISASDIRLKKNIVRIGKTVKGIALYAWDWNEKGREITGQVSSAGVIAQEVMGIIPEAVIMGADGYLRVNYAEIS